MRVLWISPTGTGLAAVQPLLDRGDTVVGYGPTVNERLPEVKQAQLYPFAAKADLLVVDSPFPLVKTPSSWRPSQESLFIEELRRHHQIRTLGATPTVDLLHGDARYLRKWCKRLALVYDPAPGEPAWEQSAWWSDMVDDISLAPWKALFQTIQFRGYFTLRGVVDDLGRRVASCDATLPNGSGLLPYIDALCNPPS